MYKYTIHGPWDIGSTATSSHNLSSLPGRCDIISLGSAKKTTPLRQAPTRRSETFSCLRCKGASFQQSLHFDASSIWQAADGSGVVPTCGSKVTETKKD